MTRDRGTPNRWPPTGPIDPGGKRQRPVPPAPKPRPAPEASRRQAVEGRKGQPNPSQRPKRSKNPKNPHPSQAIAPQDATSQVQAMAVSPVPLKPFSPRLKLPTSWRFWAIATVVTSGGLAFLAVAMLLRLPALPNCPSIFWPTASASLRLYCAQVAANKQTVDNLLKAIELVDSLPSDHPLRPEINRNIEQWSLDILNLAEEDFNGGRLSNAIAIARRIPKDTPAYKLVDERIERWQTIWDKAEDIYQQAEAELRKQNWRQAFLAAVRLLSVGNTYWETVKYQEINDRIKSARDDGNKLAKAQDLADRGGVDNLLAAIKLAESIGKKSYVYQEAQKAIAEYGRKMLNLAQETLDARDSTGAIAIARKIPASAKLQNEVEDFATLADAQSQAWRGTVASLEGAIAEAQKITNGRPLYGKAQQLITRWQREIEGVATLERARQLAQGGTLEDLGAAIAEANTISRSNPRWDEAQGEINRWTGEIQTAEDRPYLNRAEEYALAGDPASLEAAIQEARQIGPGRALHGEAQEKIRQWTRQLQRMEDQPYLDQARALASAGDLPGAIEVAGQIRSGRALYDEAQTEIESWRSRIRAQQRWQEAQSLASSATPDALAAAIRAADEIPSSSPLRIDADEAITLWSQRILELAETQARYDLNAAIAIAQKVPPRTEAYASAQNLINEWRRALAPPEPVSEAPEPPPSN